MSDILSPALRLPAPAECTVLDPAFGPTARPVGLLGVGDLVLTQTESGMGFLPVSAVLPTAAPRQLAVLPQNTLGEGQPAHDLLLARRQRVAIAQAGSDVRSLAALPHTLPAEMPESWVEIAIAGASRLVVDGIAVLLTHPDAPAPSLLEEMPLRAFAGTAPATLIEAVETPGGAELHFDLPPRTALVRLVSDPFLPPGDCRELGVAMLRVSVDGHIVALDDPSLVQGFHPLEQGDEIEWRWTEREALLMVPPRGLSQRLDIRITDWHRQS